MIQTRRPYPRILSMALDGLNLPINVVSRADVSRLRRELLDLDNYIKQAKLRQPGTLLKTLPKTSKNLNDFAIINNLNLLSDEDRDKTGSFMDDLLAHAPIVHISFATDPSAAFMSKITTWFRTNIDRLVLVNVGLEPTIAAGCTLRTDNQFHDFSLRRHFDEQRSFLLSKIRESSN